MDEARLLDIICQRLSIGSRVNREVHARFWEHLGVRVPRATRQVFVRIGGVLYYLWRAVDQDGVVLDILIQSRRDAGAAKRFFKRLLKGLQYVPRVLITDRFFLTDMARRCLPSGGGPWSAIESCRTAALGGHVERLPQAEETAPDQ